VTDLDDDRLAAETGDPAATGQPGPVPEVAGVTFRALGTDATVLVTKPSCLDAAHELLATELAAIDLACSRFRDDSELARLNRAGGQPVPVSALFATAIEVALRAAELTGGDVDPTCGQALVSLGYDRDFDEVTRAPDRAAAPPMPLPGWRAVRLDAVAGTVSVPAGVLLDLGATAKALAADRAAGQIATALGCGVLVNLGGDIAAVGRPPVGGWRVRVTDSSKAADDAPGQTVVVHGGGLATSSTTIRAWRMAGLPVHHIVAPLTGSPARSCWRTVSVAAATCVDANTASTAAIIRDYSAIAWLEGLGLPARLVRTDGAVITVSGWPRDEAADRDAGGGAGGDVSLDRDPGSVL
jgi:thiamine biosynthesis lipoprotein